MLHQRLSLVCLAACAIGSAGAAPIISPYAADLAASAYTTDRVAGGSAQSAFNGGYWNAGAHGWHWIEADMGGLHTLSEVRYAIDVMPSTSTIQYVFLSDTPIGNRWTTLTPTASRSGPTLQFQQFELDFTATAGRYLQIVSYGGASWTAIGDGSPRSNWVDPAPQPGAGGSTGTGGSGGGGGGGGPNGVPEPASAALVAMALGLLRLTRRRAA